MSKSLFLMQAYYIGQVVLGFPRPLQIYFIMTLFLAGLKGQLLKSQCPSLTHLHTYSYLHDVWADLILLPFIFVLLKGQL